MENKQVKQVKKIGFVEKLRRTFVGIILLGVLYGINCGYNAFIDYTNTKNFVEPYCAARYSHDVEEYKTCKDLKPTELIKKLTQEVNDKQNVEFVNLPPLKM